MARSTLMINLECWQKQPLTFQLFANMVLVNLLNQTDLIILTQNPKPNTNNPWPISCLIIPRVKTRLTKPSPSQNHLSPCSNTTWFSPPLALLHHPPYPSTSSHLPRPFNAQKTLQVTHNLQRTILAPKIIQGSGLNPVIQGLGFMVGNAQEVKKTLRVPYI